ncbi:hypothetical protein RB595_003844 [Gaeumannomyces hyphopodioides]
MAVPSVEYSYRLPAPFAIIECPLDLAGDAPCSVTKVSYYNWYGCFDAESLAESAGAFIAANTTSGGSGGTTVDPLPAIKQAVAYFLGAAARDAVAIADPAARPAVARSCWLTVRLFKPTDEFATPRWHRDGVMFNCSCPGHGVNGAGGAVQDGNHNPQAAPTQTTARHHAKYAVTLLGPPTRLMQPGALVDEAVADYEADVCAGGDEMAARAALAESLRGAAGTDEVALPSPRQVIRFSWGQDDSPVHSEPDWGSSDRVFVTVLFGSEEEIRNISRYLSRPSIEAMSNPSKEQLDSITRQAESDLNTYEAKVGHDFRGQAGFDAGVDTRAEKKFPSAEVRYGEDLTTEVARGRNGDPDAVDKAAQ